MASGGFWAQQRWERIAPLAGVVAVALWVVGIFVLEGATDSPDAGSAEEALAYFEGDSDAILGGTYAFCLGIPFFLWFAGSLRSLLYRAEGSTGRLSAVAFGSALATAVLLLGFAVPSIAGALAFEEDETGLTADAAQALWTVGDGFFVASWFTIAPLFAATAIIALRTGALPRWHAWVGLLFAVAILVPWVGWAVLIFGFPLWVLLTSVLVWRRPVAVVEPGETAVPQVRRTPES